MKKIYFYIAAVILAAIIGVVFLLTRPSDYQAHFNVKATPDIAFNNILNWNTWNRSQLNSKIEILSKIPVSNISQKVTLVDTTLIINWEFKTLNDSITTVRAYISDPDRKLYNRLTGTFINTRFREGVRNNLIDIKTRMELTLEKFHYKFTGYHHFDKKSCVYINLNSTRRGKAMTMMLNVTELNQFVRQNNLGFDGKPFLIVHDWDVFKDSINFDFCFPITRINSVPKHPKIKFMTFEGMDAVKTDFYGNYSITDFTWFKLAEETKKLGYRSNNKLIEVYYNDPHSGGDELEWKAEIYLGIESVK